MHMRDRDSRYIGILKMPVQFFARLVSDSFTDLMIKVC